MGATVITAASGERASLCVNTTSPPPHLLTDLEHPSIRSANDLANTMIIGFRKGCAYRSRLQRWMAEAGVPLPRMLEFDTSEVIVGCVAAGLGAAIMPAAVVGNLGFTDQIQCHPLPEKYASSRTMMIWRSDSRHHADHHALAESFLARTGSHVHV